MNLEYHPIPAGMIVLDTSIKLKAGDRVPCPVCGQLDWLRETFTHFNGDRILSQLSDFLDSAPENESRPNGELVLFCEYREHPILVGLGNWKIFEVIPNQEEDWPTLAEFADYDVLSESDTLGYDFDMLWEYANV